MVKNRKVSVIVPVYNVEKYLPKCIDSILKQSYDNIELLLIDDGSNDNSPEICAASAAKDGRVIFVKQNNSGPSVARNMGISMATGEYIQFVDSDDFLEPNAIDNLVKAINNVDIAIAGYYNLILSGDQEMRQLIEYDKNGDYEQTTFLTFFGEVLNAGIFHYVWNKLYKTDIVKQILFHEEIKIGEDMLFNLDYLEHVNSISVIKEPVYNHIWYNQESIKKKYHPDLFDMRRVINQRTVAFLTNHNSYRGANKLSVDLLYAKKVTGCFRNVIIGNEVTGIKQGIALIDYIITDYTVRNVTPCFLNGKISSRLLGLLIHWKMSSVIYFVYYTGRKFKRAGTPIFLGLKKLTKTS